MPHLTGGKVEIIAILFTDFKLMDVSLSKTR
jgi:hypothetical protein